MARTQCIRSAALAFPADILVPCTIPSPVIPEAMPLGGWGAMEEEGKAVTGKGRVWEVGTDSPTQ